MNTSLIYSFFLSGFVLKRRNANLLGSFFFLVSKYYIFQNLYLNLLNFIVSKFDVLNFRCVEKCVQVTAFSFVLELLKKLCSARKP